MSEKKAYVLFEVKLVPETPPMVITTQQELVEAILKQAQAAQKEALEAANSSQYKRKKKKKEKSDDDAPKFKTVYEFIAQVHTPEEVAEIVRRDPHKNYMLFEGITKPIAVQIPVLIDGIPSDSLSSEWANLGPFNPDTMVFADKPPVTNLN
jgi:hypothetical protein